MTPERQALRLDILLSQCAPDLSRARIQALIGQGLVLVDGQPAKPGKKTPAGQKITLTVPPNRPGETTPDFTVDFTILHQDHDIVVIDKPPGLVVHPAPGHWEGTLVHGLLAACPDLEGVGGETRPGIVHRLDKDTSGVMVAAKTQQAHEALVQFFKTGGIGKTYLAFTVGWPRDDAGLIDLAIGRHPVRRKEMSTRSTSGRRALTRYEVITRFSLGVSLLRLILLTGRTHQIRVHLAALGCPVLGDRVYGHGTGTLKGGGTALRNLAGRQMLHSHRLKFRHPVTGLPMEFEAPVPDDMSKVLQLLESPDV